MRILKKIIGCMAAAAALAAAPASAQNVTVDAAIDSFQLFIGEQARLKLEVSLDAGKRLRLPDYDKELVEGVEIVERSEPDTQFLNNRQRLLVTQEYTITAFDSACYYIPPIQVLVDGDPYYSKELALYVYTLPVDTLHPEAFFGPKALREIPLTWAEWGPLLLWLLLAAIGAALCLLFFKRYRDNKPIIRIVKSEPKLPPHIVALREIERIKSEEKGHSQETKEYYTHLTDAVRSYIRDRFGFSALEMTSSQIIERLMQESDKESLKELADLFATADLVKFAKHHPLINENDLNLLNAVEFVNRTKATGADADKITPPTEIKVVDERSKRAKMWLLAGGIALALAAVTAVVLLILKIHYIWF